MPLLPENAECFVSVFKAGALARIGHDVMLQFQGMTLTVAEDQSMRAEFRTDSLQVVGALKDGRPQPGLLSMKDSSDIAGNIRKVLEPGRFPVAVFESTSVRDGKGALEIVGELTLHGVTRRVQVRAERADGMATARVVVNQSDYAIKPFKALLGALRIKPEVYVEIRVPYADA